MEKIQLYGDYQSQPVRAVYGFLKENEIPFEFKPVDLFRGGLTEESYLKNVNPLSKMPTIIDGALKTGESHAIMRYLQLAYCPRPD